MKHQGVRDAENALGPLFYVLRTSPAAWRCATRRSYASGGDRGCAVAAQALPAGLTPASGASFRRDCPGPYPSQHSPNHRESVVMGGHTDGFEMVRRHSSGLERPGFGSVVRTQRALRLGRECERWLRPPQECGSRAPRGDGAFSTSGPSPSWSARLPHDEMIRFIDEHRDRFAGRGHLPHAEARPTLFRIEIVHRLTWSPWRP